MAHVGGHDPHAGAGEGPHHAEAHAGGAPGDHCDATLDRLHGERLPDRRSARQAPLPRPQAR